MAPSMRFLQCIACVWERLRHKEHIRTECNARSHLVHEKRNQLPLRHKRQAYDVSLTGVAYD
jgi:hypothetical protein